MKGYSSIALFAECTFIKISFGHITRKQSDYIIVINSNLSTLCLVEETVMGQWFHSKTVE